jgi:hypothetical protein
LRLCDHGSITYLSSLILEAEKLESRTVLVESSVGYGICQHDYDMLAGKSNFWNLSTGKCKRVNGLLLFVSMRNVSREVKLLEISNR